MDGRGRTRGVPCRGPSTFSVFFFFNDTATTEIYTLSLHDALPIYDACEELDHYLYGTPKRGGSDRKSTRLNSSHLGISYAVFCLKKKKKKLQPFNTMARTVQNPSIIRTFHT